MVLRMLTGAIPTYKSRRLGLVLFSALAAISLNGCGPVDLDGLTDQELTTVTVTANAGPDRQEQLPLNEVVVEGSGSATNDLDVE